MKRKVTFQNDNVPRAEHLFYNHVMLQSWIDSAIQNTRLYTSRNVSTYWYLTEHMFFCATNCEQSVNSQSQWWVVPQMWYNPMAYVPHITTWLSTFIIGSHMQPLPQHVIYSSPPSYPLICEKNVTYLGLPWKWKEIINWVSKYGKEDTLHMGAKF